MSGRYAGWRRLSGDTERPDLLDLGRKLLGYLDNQRKLSGVPTISEQVTLPDGSVVTARWVGNLPQLHIKAGGGKTIEVPLEGIVVRPSDNTDQYANTDKNHVVLRAGETPCSFFFDADAVPSGFTGRRGYYGTALTDGYLHYGTVDWRNADESHLVSWHGPNTRYLDDANYPKQYVYHKGRVLVNLQEADVVTALGRSDYVCLGACIRTDDDGDALIVVATRESSSIGRFLYDYVLRFGLRVSAGVNGTLKTAGRIEIDAEDMQVLWSREIGEDALEGMNHPWYFNASGTEARCFRRAVGTHLYHECVLGVPLDNSGANYATSTDDDDAVDRNNSITQRVGRIPCAIHDPSDMLSVNPGDPGNNMVVGNAQEQCLDGDYYNKSYVAELTLIPSQTWARRAVDFRGDQPVYLSIRRPASTTTRTIDFEFTHQESVEITDFDPGVPYANDGSWKERVEKSIVASYACEETSSAVVCGFDTDWMRVEETAQSATSRGFTCAISHGKNTKYYGDLSPPSVLEDYGDEELTGTLVGGSLITSESSGATGLVPAHFDLRYKVAVYGIARGTGATSRGGATDSDEDGGTYKYRQLRHSTNSVSTFTTYITRNGITLASAEVSSTSGGEFDVGKWYTGLSILDHPYAAHDPFFQINWIYDNDDPYSISGEPHGLGAALDWGPLGTFSPVEEDIPDFIVDDEITESPFLNDYYVYCVGLGATWVDRYDFPESDVMAVGSWASYKGSFAWSQAMPSGAPSNVNWSHGFLGKGPSSLETWAGSATRYHPLTVLTKTTP